jgi:Tfp pilus assembly protein FimT
LFDVVIVMAMIATAVTTVGPLSRHVVARYRLNSAAQTLVADLSRARMTAIQTNAVTTVKRLSTRDYRVAGTPRQLPRGVHFADSSTDSIGYNGLGTMQDGVSHRFHLFNTFGDSVQVLVYAGGGHQVVKP